MSFRNDSFGRHKRELTRLQKKARVEGLTSRDRRIVQMRIRALQKDGPTGVPANALNPQVRASSASVITALNALSGRLARSMSGSPNWREAIGPVDEALNQQRFAMRTVKLELQVTEGLNMNWTAHVTLKAANHRQVGQGGANVSLGNTGQQQNTSGSSASTSSSTTVNVQGGQTTSVSGSATVPAGGTPVNVSAGQTSSVSGGVTHTTSQTTSANQAQTGSNNTGTTATGQNQVENWQCDILADIDVKGELDYSGIDYINPFRWGASISDSMDNAGRTETQNDIKVGDSFYSMPGTFSGAAATP